VTEETVPQPTYPLPPAEPDVAATDTEGNELPDDVADGEVAGEDEPAGANPDTGVEPSDDEDEDEVTTP
jgi:hypothetical protein